MLICPRCTTENAEGATRCTYCAQLLGEAALPAPMARWAPAVQTTALAYQPHLYPGMVTAPIFATAGDDDIDDAGKALGAIFRASAPKGLVWYYEPRADLLHSTIYRGASPGALRKLFPPEKKLTP